MRRLILINIVASVVIWSYFYLFIPKEKRDSFFSKNSVSQTFGSSKMNLKKTFNKKERAKESKLAKSSKEFNPYLGQSRLDISSFALERKSNIQKGRLIATNTLSFTLESKPNYTAEIENETKELMRKWISLYKHDSDEITKFNMVFQGKNLYQVNSKGL